MVKKKIVQLLVGKHTDWHKPLFLANFLTMDEVDDIFSLYSTSCSVKGYYGLC